MIGTTNPITLTVDASKVVTATFASQMAISHTANQPGIAPAPDGSTLLTARVTPPTAGVTVNFTITSDIEGDSLDSPFAVTDAEGKAAVTYNAGSGNHVVRIDAGVDGTAISDPAYVYVASGTAATEQGRAAPGPDTKVTLAPSIVISKTGSGESWWGVAQFAGDPCPQSSQVVEPYGRLRRSAA